MFHIVMVCENIKCKKNHDGLYATGRFCSKSCSQARNFNDKQKLNISKGIRSSDRSTSYTKRSENKILCDKCGEIFTKYQFNKHKGSDKCLKRCNDISVNRDTILVIDDKFLCSICNREFKSISNVKCHIKKKHLGKVYGRSGRKIGSVAWNKGLTKETSDILLAQSKRRSIKQKEECRLGLRMPPKMSEEKRIELSRRQSLKNSGGKSKWYKVDGKSVQGTWERNVALKFEEFGIEWIKPIQNKDVWPYYVDGKLKNYSPDFYLPKFDIYLEIKGFWWGSDKEKMRIVMLQHTDKNLIIVEKDNYERILNNDFYFLKQQIPR